jgi:hypothetical protein
MSKFVVLLKRPATHSIIQEYPITATNVEHAIEQVRQQMPGWIFDEIIPKKNTRKA